jgi:hypothetical protein
MIKSLKTFLLLLLIPFVSQTGYADSPLVQYLGNGHYYQRIDTFKTWTNARDHCQSLNGYLATLTSKEENDFAYQNLIQQVTQPGVPVLLGSTDQASEGNWQWTTGETWSYTNWAPGQPDNNGGQDYLAFWNNPAYPGQWDDTYGEVLLPFICEWDWPTNVTDIWWKPGEGGWGMNLVQSGSFVFATVYIYGPDGKPTWVTGELRETTATGVLTFSGPLYVTSGPYFGGPFNPALFHFRQAGIMTFKLTAENAGQLSYSVDGVLVNKEVQRQPLTRDNYDGTYESVEIVHVTNCSNPAGNGDHTNRHTVLITQNGSAMTITFGTLGIPGGSCTATGNYSQLGRMGQFVGQYACPWNEIGTYALTQMNSSYRQFSARVSKSSSNLGCVSVGQTTGLIEY